MQPGLSRTAAMLCFDSQQKEGEGGIMLQRIKLVQQGLHENITGVHRRVHGNFSDITGDATGLVGHVENLVK